MAGAKIEKTQTQQAYNIIILIRIKLEGENISLFHLTLPSSITS
ncbi:MAG: hypothetical protein WA395_15350 [Nitrososphaeraceae archaeon]